MKKLIIIHGWTYTIEPWTKTVELLQRAGVEVEQLRVPGLTEPSNKVWTVDDYVEWLREELAGHQNVVVLGHSNGGRIAMNYLAKYPSSFEQLILLNSAGIFYKPEAMSLKRRVARVVAKIGKPLAKLPLVRKVFYRIIGSDYGRAPENMKKTLSNMLESDKQLDLSQVKVDKIDILWGKDDQTTPVGMGRVLHGGLAGSSLQEFSDWRHAPYITHPEELAEAILEVLQ